MHAVHGLQYRDPMKNEGQLQHRVVCFNKIGPLHCILHGAFAVFNGIVRTRRLLWHPSQQPPECLCYGARRREAVGGAAAGNMQ